MRSEPAWTPRPQAADGAHGFRALLEDWAATSRTFRRRTCTALTGGALGRAPASTSVGTAEPLRHGQCDLRAGKLRRHARADGVSTGRSDGSCAEAVASGMDLLSAQALTKLAEPVKFANRERPDGSNYQSFPSATLSNRRRRRDRAAPGVEAQYLGVYACTCRVRLHDNKQSERRRVRRGDRATVTARPRGWSPSPGWRSQGASRLPFHGANVFSCAEIP
jgi:hypothetical protein